MFWSLVTGGTRMPFHGPFFGVSVSNGICRWAELQDIAGMGDRRRLVVQVKTLGLGSEQDKNGRPRGKGCLFLTTENLDMMENDVHVPECVCWMVVGAWVRLSFCISPYLKKNLCWLTIHMVFTF